MLFAIFPFEGFSGASQSSVAGYSQLPFLAASQTHLTSGIQGTWETLNNHNKLSYHMTFVKRQLSWCVINQIITFLMIIYEITKNKEETSASEMPCHMAFIISSCSCNCHMLLPVCICSNLEMLCCIILHITILPSEGFSGGSQSSVAGYSQPLFPSASQTHLRSGIQGWWALLFLIKTKLSLSIYMYKKYYLSQGAFCVCQTPKICREFQNSTPSSGHKPPSSEPSRL